MCSPRKNNRATAVGYRPNRNSLTSFRPFFHTGTRPNTLSLVARLNNSATCKGDIAPPVELTEFTREGETFNLATGYEFISNFGDYEIKLVTMVSDGVLSDFWMFISDNDIAPPSGVSYGVSYLDTGGNYRDGFAVRFEI